MDSTFEQYDGEKTKSLQRSWQHCNELILASSRSEAWQALQNLMDAMPIWALLLLPVLATLCVIDSSAVVVTLAAGAFLFAIYATVRRAVADGLRESR